MGQYIAWQKIIAFEQAHGSLETQQQAFVDGLACVADYPLALAQVCVAPLQAAAAQLWGRTVTCV
jgi:hypothetical protein